MSKFSLLTLLLLSAAGAAESRADEAAVRTAIDVYVKAFNQRDFDTVASLWAEEGIHIDRETGQRTEGRDAIRADIRAVVEEQPGVQLAGRVDRVRFINPDVAKVEGQTSVGSPGQDPSLSAFSAILVNKNGKWLVDSVEETPLPQPATPYQALRDLEWLVGRWVDDSDAVRVDTTFRWTEDRAFLLRSFVVQVDDGVAQQGTQVIGWDPRSNQIRSWSFHSDGSFGDGIWSQSGEEWLIKSSQTLADGQAASGTYILQRTDSDTLTLQLIGHEVEGEPQPASPPVRVVRVAEENPLTSPPAKN